MKILITDGFLVNAGGVSWKPLEAIGEVVYYDDTAPEQLAERLLDVDAAFTNRVRFPAEVFQHANRLKMIGTFGTGVDFIDGAAARQHGVAVCNIPGYGRGAVAQMALALLFEICRQTSSFNRYMKEIGWEASTASSISEVRQIELTGKTIGILGMGDIGYAIAKMALAMDMKVLAYRRTPVREWECEGLRYVDQETLFAQSDIVSVNCPLTEATRHIINRETIAKMKDGVILLNVSRGALLDTEAVVQALDSGKIYRAGVDVFDPEPCGKGHPIAVHPHCIASPHAAWAPFETRQNLVNKSAENLQALLNGTPKNQQN